MNSNCTTAATPPHSDSVMLKHSYGRRLATSASTHGPNGGSVAVQPSSAVSSVPRSQTSTPPTDSDTNSNPFNRPLKPANAHPSTSQSSATSAASSSSTTSENSEALDFQKRDISDSASRRSYSQLSTLTANSPEVHIEVPPQIDNVSLQSDDDRIRNPASAALKRVPVGEKIGFREPFGDTSASAGASSTANGSQGSQASSSPRTSPRTTDGFYRSPQLTPHSVMTGPPPQPRRKYEPARVVLHKSELNAPYGASDMRRSSSVISEMPLVPHSLVMSLAGSPVECSSNGPIKHIRDPKQPIYVPAVLRPTEEASYDSGSPNSSVPGSIASASMATGASAVLHSQKPVTRHWVRDESASQCLACERQFTWYRRRHHCRKCGGVFCSMDTKRTIGLDRILNFNLLGVPCRACDKCASEFAAFCLDSPRLQDGPLSVQQPIQGTEQEELEVGGGGDWSTF